MLACRKCLWILLVSAVASGCSTVPKEAVELSNTVGRDLEEVHRAHHALAELYFDQTIDKLNAFIDDTYRPAFIAKFAEEFKLNDQIKRILDKDPDKLLPVLTGFVTIATERIEKKRDELLAPIQTQRREVLTSIDIAHRQIRAAQAIVTGHLASVRKVHEVQNQLLAEVGLEDVRQRIAARTASVSDAVADIVKQGKKIDAGADVAQDKLEKLDAAIDKAKDKLTELTK